MKPGRIPCCVPFCRRTGAREKHPHATEIICGRCWRAGVPKALRMIYSRAWRGAKRAGERYDSARLAMEQAAKPRARPICDEWDVSWRACERAYARCHRVWAICKRRAIEGRTGLA